MVSPPREYGIWNSVTKRFVFGIREATPERAWQKFCRIGEVSFAWRYNTKEIPLGWENPPNPTWPKKGKR